MFIKIEPNHMHGVFIYSPRGHNVRDGMSPCEGCTPTGCTSNVTLHLGESVIVQSLWFRNAYPGDPLILAYVRGEFTHDYTHVVIGDLVKYLQ